MSSGNIVKLNIGGTVFQTSKSTLTKFDGFFKIMLETDIPLEKDDSGCIFIDRDPQHFRLILNFMRDGDVILPKTEEDILEIQKEAHYYLLENLVELCNATIPAKTETSNKIRVIESESEYLQIISNIVKPVLIIHCPIDNYGSVDCPDGFNANSFWEKHNSHLNIYFHPFKKTENMSWSWTLKNANTFTEGCMQYTDRSFLEKIEGSITFFLEYFSNV